MAYDEGKITANDSFFCDGRYERKLSSGETIHKMSPGTHGWVNARTALGYSCNDALGQMNDRLDGDFISKIRELGFGTRTGIELPGETAGSVKDPAAVWSARSKPTIAIGQEISVSALQMIQATTAIADGGVPVRLTVIRKITNKDGSTYFEHQVQYKERMFRKATAEYLLSCMETTAETGTKARALISAIYPSV